MAEKKILTKHPQPGRTGRNIAKDKYDAVAKAMRGVLRKGELTHPELMDRMITALKGKFEGNISWYAETVKLDLEARRVIERTKSKPQRYRLR